MSLSQIQSLFAGQGLVFWAAVTAVTLGLTLLSVAIVFQVRKVVGTSIRPWFAARRTSRQRSAPARTRPQVTATADGYRASGFVPAAPAADPLLASLLARLKVSADRLENMHGSLGSVTTAPRRTADSLLKDPSNEVDYVYQAGRA